ncbi:MAG: lytic transglycosylase domain-containing protein [Nocardioides sp.]|uniref:aggregation-promoting factor C-terminal-like domain-containing protein n=1 Tax=Nocardioides sp. TaxID=35761 RepID=UPI003F0EB1A2
MSETDKYVPKHRAPGRHKAVTSRRTRVVRTSLAMTSLAAVATGATVATGVGFTDDATRDASLLAGADLGAAVADTGADEQAAEILANRDDVVSRSDRRGETDSVKQAALTQAGGVAVTREENLATGDPRDIARVLLSEYGFAASEFSCLDSLYASESGWRVDADNPSSSAYGIPQALTATHDLPEGYMTSAEVQIRWGLEYIKNRYGTPCAAWSFKSSRGWY